LSSLPSGSIIESGLGCAKEDLAAVSRIEGEAQAEIDEIKGYTGTQAQHCKSGAAFAAAVREALKRADITLK